MTAHIQRRKGTYLALILFTTVSGLASRKLAAYLPAFLATYAGDTLWALLVFLLLGLVHAAAPTLHNALFALAFSYAIEISQLYQADWLNAIRHTTLGGLVLGFGFLWSDWLCYTAGVLLGATGEWLLLRRR